MAGIYLHIPFCRQACHYCDFHFSTNLSKREEMIRAMAVELQQRQGYLNEKVNTVYFGGGTPSLLTGSQLSQFLNVIYSNYPTSPHLEITLEANPEDLAKEKFNEFLALGINRLSLGVQTFSEDRLKWMNRNHDSKESVNAYRTARSVGFENISVDLMYAVPETGSDGWLLDLEQACMLSPEHLSLYNLTIEEHTVFGRRKSKGRLSEVKEEEAAHQFLAAVDFLQLSGYHQYEVSNFSKLGYESRHNASYWAGGNYLGIGPGAHSFDGKSRQWNIRSNARYIHALENNLEYFEFEKLDRTQQMNEKIMTQLRTTAGLDFIAFKKQFEVDLPQAFEKEIGDMESHEIIVINENRLSLTRKGILVADEVALNLFFDEQKLLLNRNGRT